MLMVPELRVELAGRNMPATIVKSPESETLRSQDGRFAVDGEERTEAIPQA